jgi:SAM-dependent methyltransferase
VNPYSQPLYYEIAFGFVDAPRQVDLFERFIKRHSRIGVARVLDIGCGPSLQLREMARRGYQAVGLDVSREMLKYLAAKARQEGVTIEAVRADMTDFALTKKVDFAINMMGTFNLIPDNDRVLAHFDAVARALKRGGLYLIQNLKLDWAGEALLRSESWTLERDGVRVTTRYDSRLKDALVQIITETLTMEVDDHGRQATFRKNFDTKMVFPQEFVALVELSGKFEFVGWFAGDRMRRLARPSMDNIVVLRRK